MTVRRTVVSKRRLKAYALVERLSSVPVASLMYLFVARAPYMTFVASPRIRSVGCIYADRCVYAPDAAYTHMCLYAVVGAYMRVGAFTRPRVRIRR